MKQKLTAVAVLIYQNGKLLLIQRARDPWKEMWATPGGKPYENETPENTVVREVGEELNVRFYPVKEVGNYHYEDEKYTGDTLVFEGTIEGEIKIKPDEILQYKWLTPEETLNLQLASTNRQRILDFIERSKT